MLLLLPVAVHFFCSTLQGGDVVMFLNEKRDAFLTISPDDGNGDKCKICYIIDLYCTSDFTYKCNLFIRIYSR